MWTRVAHLCKDAEHGVGCGPCVETGPCGTRTPVPEACRLCPRVRPSSSQAEHPGLPRSVQRVLGFPMQPVWRAPRGCATHPEGVSAPGSDLPLGGLSRLMEPGSKSKDPEEPSGAGSTLSRSPESQSVTSALGMPRLGCGGGACWGRPATGVRVSGHQPPQSHQSPERESEAWGRRRRWAGAVAPCFLGCCPHSAPAPQGRRGLQQG